MWAQWRHSLSTECHPLCQEMKVRAHIQIAVIAACMTELTMEDKSWWFYLLDTTMWQATTKPVALKQSSLIRMTGCVFTSARWLCWCVIESLWDLDWSNSACLALLHVVSRIPRLSSALAFMTTVETQCAQASGTSNGQNIIYFFSSTLLTKTSSPQKVR